MLNTTKVYETESYDYPTQVRPSSLSSLSFFRRPKLTRCFESFFDTHKITESVAELGGTISHNFALFASKNLQGTSLPLPTPGSAPVPQPKTLPHALSRAAASATVDLGEGDRLGTALSQYSLAMGKVRDQTLCVIQTPLLELTLVLDGLR
jgi:hypothetical protein